MTRRAAREVLSDDSHNAAKAAAADCITMDAGPEPEPSGCCGARAFLFGHVHLIPDPLVIIDGVVNISGGSNVAHGRWGPLVHMDDCVKR